MIKGGHQVTTWNTSTIGTGLTVGVMGFTYQYLIYGKMLYITFLKNVLLNENVIYFVQISGLFSANSKNW